MRRSLLLAVPVVSMISVLVGCSDDESGSGIDTDALKDSFTVAAVDAYETEGRSRDDDFLQGVRSPCFALDDEAIEAIGEVLGLEGDLTISSPYLQGKKSDEQLSCSVKVDDGRAFALTLGTIGLDAAGIIEQRAKLDPESEVIEREPDGFDSDQVVGFRNGDTVAVTYVADGFYVGLVATGEGIDEDEAYAGLPVAVDQVSRVLSAAT